VQWIQSVSTAASTKSGMQYSINWLNLDDTSLWRSCRSLLGTSFAVHNVHCLLWMRRTGSRLWLTRCCQGIRWQDPHMFKTRRWQFTNFTGACDSFKHTNVTATASKVIKEMDSFTENANLVSDTRFTQQSNWTTSLMAWQSIRQNNQENDSTMCKGQSRKLESMTITCTAPSQPVKRRRPVHQTQVPGFLTTSCHM